jgi:hypothetical protein
MTGLAMKYFVLKPKGSDVYAKASRAAMRRYATTIREENLELSNALRDWADKEQFADMGDGTNAE